MTQNKYDALIQKIFWFSLPLIISLLTFLVINTFTVKSAVDVVATKSDERAALQEKMWAMIQTNNSMLQNKLDVNEYLIKHKELENKIDVLQLKVDKIYNKQGKYISDNQKKDSILFSPGVWQEIVMNKKNN